MPSKFHKAHGKLSRLRNRALANLRQKHEHAYNYLQEKKLLLPAIREQSAKLLTGAALTTSLLLNTKTNIKPLSNKTVQERLKIGLATSDEVKRVLSVKLTSLLSDKIGILTGDARTQATQVLKDILGLEARVNLEGKELNYAYGWMGYEQHLQRYPGDTVDQHDEEQVAGIAPGLGAWGYFAYSKDQMTADIEKMEKYYVAVQTLYLPDWYTNTKELSQWYKYRKVIVLNPQNGEACVAVVADAGPANWTGKQFGGSPEVMKSLDLHLGPRKGKVLLMFVDDKENKIPLGPIDFNIGTGKPVSV